VNIDDLHDWHAKVSVFGADIILCNLILYEEDLAEIVATKFNLWELVKESLGA